jgi:tRNA (guanine-N7-)-methyltransferase
MTEAAAPRPQWSQTKNIPFPNIYVRMLPEYKNWIFLEDEAVGKKGAWRDVFADPSGPLDLEIGCGNGFFFAERSAREHSRNLLGIELKYKPLVQSVRRVKTADRGNCRGIRFHARFIDRIFSERELDHIFIYFPDPWPKKRHHKNRLLRASFLEMLSRLQKPGCYVDIKTDSREYFDFLLEEMKSVTTYSTDRLSFDLHKSEWAPENFMTGFERIFVRKGQPIHYLRLTNTTR